MPELEAPVKAEVEKIKRVLAPWAARHMYLNFAETRREPATFWSEQAHRRLLHIRQTSIPKI